MVRAIAALLFSGLLAGTPAARRRNPALAQQADPGNHADCPGTGADVVFRLVFHELSNRLGQQIVIENRGGAGGTIGSAAPPRPIRTATRSSRNRRRTPSRRRSIRIWLTT